MANAIPAQSKGAAAPPPAAPPPNPPVQGEAPAQPTEPTRRVLVNEFGSRIEY